MGIVFKRENKKIVPLMASMLTGLQFAESDYILEDLADGRGVKLEEEVLYYFEYCSSNSDFFKLKKMETVTRNDYVIFFNNQKYILEKIEPSIQR